MALIYGFVAEKGSRRDDARVLDSVLADVPILARGDKAVHTVLAEVYAIL